MTYPVELRDPPRRRRLASARTRLTSLRLPGGYDAGEQMRPVYEEVGRTFPCLPATCQIEPDGTTEAVCYGLTSLVPLGVVKFSVQDEMVLPLKTGRHECGHGTEWVLIAMAMALFGWTEPQARNWFRTAYWTARFATNGVIPVYVPQTWQAAQADADADSGTSQWMKLPGESIAECFANVVYGYFVGEKTNSYGVELAPRLDAMRQFFDDMMMEVGVLTMKQLDFYLTLVNGRADTFDNPISEAERVQLNLVPGRPYVASVHRIWLNGSETTLPDTVVGQAAISENPAVPVGQNGRFRFSVHVRRDFGSQGRYALHIAPRTAYVSRG